MISALSPKTKAMLLVLARPAFRYFRPAPRSHLEPVSRRWGFERGTAVGRYIIDEFIKSRRQDITGVVLEVKNRRYTDAWGSNVNVSDVVDIDESNKDANIYADLSCPEAIESDRYDCFILTETLQFVFDIHHAVRHCHRILKPGGVLLVSVPNIAPTDDELAHVDYWRFTANTCRRLFGEVFGPDHVQVKPYGNFATCVAGLSGIAAEELPDEKLQMVDEKYTQGVLVRAQKRSSET